MSAELSAPLIGTDRHRLSTDGRGVTTLVAFHGCPLRCRYCLNPQCFDTSRTWRTVTPQQLLAEVAIDNLYFQATGGGVTFGGGEPLLRSEFIAEFGKIMPPQWRITLETSLNVPRHHLERVFPVVGGYIIDIKDTNHDIYRLYTTQDNAQVLDNLRWLMSHDGMADRVVVRLPLIKDYNTPDDVARSRASLETLGITNFDQFTYVTNL